MKKKKLKIGERLEIKSRMMYRKHNSDGLVWLSAKVMITKVMKSRLSVACCLKNLFRKNLLKEILLHVVQLTT